MCIQARECAVVDPLLNEARPSGPEVPLMVDSDFTMALSWEVPSQHSEVRDACEIPPRTSLMSVMFFDDFNRFATRNLNNSVVHHRHSPQFLKFIVQFGD